nr:hypothetical protein [Tanacetum cinerariifolium]
MEVIGVAGNLGTGTVSLNHGEDRVAHGLLVLLGWVGKGSGDSVRVVEWSREWGDGSYRCGRKFRYRN